MANIKFSEFTDIISPYSNIFIVGYDSALNDNIRILSTDLPAIIGAITGSGTPGTLPKFITDTSLGDSLISDDGTEVTIAGNINATAFVKVGGTSSEFLKADGSVDSNAYITLADLSASLPLNYDNSTGAFSITEADSTTDGYLSALDWNTFNQKQAALGGTGIVKSTSGTISYITDNSANWNTAYNNMIVSAAVTGTTTKTLTLNQEDGGTITASWSDLNTDAVTSVFGRTGAVVAQSGDYTTTQVTEGTNLYFTNARARAAFSESVTGLDYNSTTGVLSTTAGYGIPTTASQSNWDTAYNDRISTANLPLDITANVISISQSSSISNGYLSSTDWTTFNNKQSAGNYITSLTGEATGSGPGAASVTLSNSAVIAKVLSDLNITGGSITSTDSILTAFGKVQNQINGLAGGVTYQGTWDASSNTPTLTSSEGTQGYYYIVNVAGSTDLDGITDWNLGDWAIFDGTVWQQVDNTDAVISVNGFVGIVSLTTTNIPEGTNLYYTNARARAAFSETVTGLDYNSTTGVLSTTSGYGIPTTASQSNWDTAYTNRISSLTTTGSSGSATLAANVLNIPTYTIAGLNGVPTSRTLTINGVTYDLAANRTWSIDSMVYPSAGIAISTGSSWGSSITDNSTDWNTAYNERISTANSPLSISSNVISIFQSGTATDGYLSATDWNTFNSKQDTLSGTGLVKSTGGTISYITDNSSNWNTAYNNMIVSAAVSGTSTKTLTLTQQDGGTVTASWSDADTGLTSVGVSMPSAFTVSNSPLTSNGTIAITGAGTTAQYVRGDGTLATFPSIANEAERLITEVYNETGATLTKGTVVYINGGHGNLPTITKALATSDATSAQTYGVVQNDITDNNNGYVVVIGSIIDLNTNAYPNGTVLYLSSTTAGEWTSVKQYAPAHLVYVGIVTRQHPTQGVVEVRVQNGYEMDELHNVAAQSPNNGDILQYVTSTQLWTKTAGTTTNIAEGTNLYYTDARSRAAFSETVVGLDYNSTTGVLGIQSGYSIPTNASQSNWDTAYTNRITSATAPLSIASNTISMSAAGISTNGYLTSTDWNTFNDKQAAGSYITALTGEATASGPGSAAITLTNNAVTAKVLTGLNITGGTVSATDSIVTAFGKVQNQINGLVGGTIYKGVWNASTNNPSLSSGVGTQGWYYIVNVAGSTNLDGITDWNIGDWAIFDGTAWQQVDNTDSVTSVNGFTGAVSLTTTNISEGTNLYYTSARFNSAFAAKTTTDLTEGTNLYFTNARAQAAISLTTLGTSGAATYSGGVLNIPQYQAALTNPVTGVGTTNYVAKWTSGSAVGNSSIYDNGTFVGIGSTTALGGRLNITFDSTTADAIILKDTRVTSGSGEWRIGPGSGVIGFGIYSNLLGYSPLAIANSGAATFSSSVTANSFVKSGGTSSQFLLADGSVTTLPTTNWDTAYNDSIVSAAVTGTTTKTLTLTQQDGGTVTASWSDLNTDAVTSVFGRTGAVVAVSGDYNTSQVTESGNLYFTNARAQAAISLTTTGTSGAATYVGGVLNIPQYTDQYVGTVTSVGLSVPTGFSVSNTPITTSGTIALGFAGGYSLPTSASQTNWDTAYTNRITSATTPLSISSNVISIAQATTSTNGYLSSTDWNTFNGKQAALNGSGIVKSTSGTISYLTDNSTNWNTAYNDSIISAAVTGTTTKTLTLNQQDGGTITASWTDINTDAVTSVFGRTGAVVAVSGDYNTSQVTESGNLYFTDARAQAAISLTTTGTSGVATYSGGVLNIPNYSSALGAYLPLAGGTLTGALYGTSAAFSSTLIIGGTTPTTKFEVYGGHNNTTARLYSTGNGSGSDASLDMWASEPYITYDGSGIGNNVNGSPYYGRRNSSLGISYIRFFNGQILLYNGTTIAIPTLTISSDNTATFSSSVTATNFFASNGGFYTNGFVIPSSAKGVFNNANYSGPAWNNAALVTGNGATGVMMGGDAGSYTYGWIQGVQTDNGANKGLYLNPLGANVLIIPNGGGNVLINTTTDAGYKLDVNGTARVSGDLTANNGIFTNGNLTIYTSGGNSSYSSQINTIYNHPYVETNIDSYAGASYEGRLKFRTNNGGGSMTTQLTIANSGAATFSSSVTASSLIKSGGTSSQYLMADGSVSTLTNPITGTGTTNYLPKFTGTSALGNSIVNDNGSRILINTGTANQNTTINASKIGMSRTSDGAEVVYFSKNTDLGANGTANINGYDGIQFRTQGAESVKATISELGNFGLGVTPSAWSSGYKAMQINATSWFSSSSRDANFGSNVFINSGGGYTYIETAASTLYTQYQGKHFWLTAPSGTAGNAITFTQAMTLASSGNLLINTTTDAGYKLDVNGTGKFNGNVVLGATSISGGGAANWLTAEGSTYGGGLISSVSGTAKAYYYYDNASNAAQVQSSSGVDVKLTAGSGGSLIINGGTGAATFSSSIDMGLNKLFTAGTYKMLYRNSSVNIAYSGTSNWQINNDADNVALMSVMNGGNVLIGTTTDAGYKLDVNGTARINGSLQVGTGVSGSGTPTQSVFQDTYGGNREAIYVKNTADYANGRGSGYGFLSGLGTEKGYLRWSADDATQTGYFLTLAVTNSSGTLITPFYIASSGAAAFSSSVSVTDSLSFGTAGNKYLYGFGGTQKFGYTNPNHNILYVGGTTGLSIYNSSDTASLVRFLDNGNVLINTTTDAGYKLDVNGNIRSSGQLHLPNNSTGTLGGLYFDYNANANSRTWQIVSDYSQYGDFRIQQSTTQTGSTFASILAFSPSGEATFSSRVTSTAWTTTGRNYSNEWIELPNYSGLYSPNNNAYLYPNNSSYGSWKISGTRNGWAGIEFGSFPNGNICLMVYPNGNHTGFYNDNFGWQFMFINGELQVGKGTYGGSLVTVLDAANYGSYALPLSGGTITGDLTVNNKVYVGTNGCYFQEVLIGSTYELQVVDSAGNITVIS